MKAIQSVVPGPPEALEIREIETPDPSEGEIRICVRSVGLNYPDLLIIEDKYQFRPDRPFSPGAEVSGVVDAVGPGVENYSVGDRVMALPLWGGLCEQVCVNADWCRRLPDEVTFEQAAALQMAYGTAYYGLARRGDLKPGERLLVLGAAGGVGLAAVDLGNLLGVHVTAVVSNEQKADAVRARGAKNTVICPRGSLDRDAQKQLSKAFRERLQGNKSDVVFDTVGGDLSNPAIRTLDWLGRFLIVGFAGGVPRIPANLALLKSCDVRGVFWGEAIKRDIEAHHSAMDDLLGFCADGRIQPQIHRSVEFGVFKDAFAELKDGKPIGKMLISI